MTMDDASADPVGTVRRTIGLIETALVKTTSVRLPWRRLDYTLSSDGLNFENLGGFSEEQAARFPVIGAVPGSPAAQGRIDDADFHATTVLALSEALVEIATLVGLNPDDGELEPILDRVRKLAQRPDVDLTKIRYLADLYLYDGDADRPLPGYERLLAAAGLLAAPAAQPAPFTDLTARLAAADAGWGLASGDGPSNPDYIRFLAQQVDAFEGVASPAAPADDEALKRLERKFDTLRTIAQGVSSSADDMRKAIDNLTPALAALREGQQ